MASGAWLSSCSGAVSSSAIWSGLGGGCLHGEAKSLWRWHHKGQREKFLPLPSCAQFSHRLYDVNGYRVSPDYLKGCKISHRGVHPSVWVGGQLDPRCLKSLCPTKRVKAASVSPVPSCWLSLFKTGKLRSFWEMTVSKYSKYICEVMSAMYCDSWWSCIS